MSRLREGMRTPVGHISPWAASRGTKARSGTSLLVVILVAIALLTGCSAQDPLDELTDLGSDEASNTALSRPPTSVASGDTGARDPESLSGTWRVFQDDSESVPLFDLTFAPGGEGVLLLQSDVPGAIENWSYTEDGDAVEIKMTYRYVAKDGGVFSPQGWLHLQRHGDEMRGRFEVDDYIYEGREKGMTVRGRSTSSEAAYARPK